jgi:hypothetical protein
VIVPRLLSPLVRTRARLVVTLGLLATLVAVPLLWPLAPDANREAATGPAPAPPPRDEATALVEARRTGTQVLVETATTATALTWALPDGQLRSTVHATPQRAKNAEGQWAPVDTTLVRDGKNPGGLDVRPVNGPATVRFSGGTAAEAARGGTGGSSSTGPDHSVLAEMNVDGHTVAYTWPGPLPEPVLDGPRALYPEVGAGIDLLLVARDDGAIGQLLIVKNREPDTVRAVSTLTYGLRSATAVFRHDATTGGVRILDRTNGREIGSIPTPFAWDSSGRENPGSTPRTAVANPADVLSLSGLSGVEPGARQGRMPTRLDGNGTGDALLHLDATATGLLTDEKSVFPVFLDPTLISGVNPWATVYSQHPNTNTYNGTNFNKGTTDARVGYEEDTPLRARSFWRMGFSTSIKGATVSAATFKILNNHSWNCTAREMQLWLTNSISTSTTWNAQPTWRREQQRLSFAHGYGSSCADDYVSFNVKDAAQEGATLGWPNIHFGMRATSESDTLTWRKFHATSAQLTVDYNRPPREPVNGTAEGNPCQPGPGGGITVRKKDITLSATATDPDNNLKRLHFRFWKVGTAVPADTPVTPTSAGYASLLIPGAGLEDKAVYSWEVRAEDHLGVFSSYFPPGNEPCRLTIDASKPSPPVVTSDVFLKATDDGATWSTVKFGQTGAITFTATDVAQFTYRFEGTGTAIPVTAVNGTATVPALAPRHAGPNTLHVYAYDAAGNQSDRTDYKFFVPPRDTADSPGDTGGDEIPDLLLVDSTGNLRNYAGDTGGELYSWQVGSYDRDGELNPPGHWYDPTTGQAALITKYADAYPGDGTTDLFARTPDGGFWLYPGDGYGSFDVDRRLRVLLPAGLPAPSTWTQIKAVGDITGDKLPDLVMRSGTQFWTLSGYTGASFQTATLMEGTAWARREIVNVADIDLDGTPDLLWRNLDNGNMYVRHGKPGPVAGSVNLDSLKSAAASRSGDVLYGTYWTEANIGVVIGIPDVNGDQVPDLWARRDDFGQMWIYHPSTTNTNAPVKIVLGDDWRSVRSFG